MKAPEDWGMDGPRPDSTMPKYNLYIRWNEGARVHEDTFPCDDIIITDGVLSLKRGGVFCAFFKDWIYCKVVDG